MWSLIALLPIITLGAMATVSGLTILWLLLSGETIVAKIAAACWTGATAAYAALLKAEGRPRRMRMAKMLAFLSLALILASVLMLFRLVPMVLAKLA